MSVVTEVSNNCSLWSGRPLRDAKDNGHEEVANWLIKHGADMKHYNGECFLDVCQCVLPCNALQHTTLHSMCYKTRVTAGVELQYISI